MKRRKGEKLTMKDISLSDQNTMSLDWAWKAGATVTYVSDYGHDWYHNDTKSCSLIRANHLSGYKDGKELWVFDMFLTSACIWD